ncbi:MAG: LysM peptidoglycan-binding domain-containing protein [Thermoflexales bacterium]|nr:LysM peptidoglycan-binding domain-containing protein [Thermoflexales bacterium]
MKSTRQSFKIFAGVIVAAIVISLIGGPQLAHASYTFVRTDPQALTVAVGQVASVYIRIDNVTNLAGVELHMTYNPAVMSIQDADPSQPGIQIAAGSLLRPDFIAQNSVDPVYGRIDFSVMQLPPSSAVSGSGVLATISFYATAAGSSPLIFSLVNLSDNVSVPIAFSVQHGQVTVGGATQPYYYPTPTLAPASNILGYHVVRAGESLYCIGRAYRVSPWAIASQNGLTYPYALWVGQQLAIPNVLWTNMTDGPVCQNQLGIWASSPQPVPTPQPYTYPTPTPQPYTYPTPVPTGSGTWYQVQYSDSLDSIAARFNTSVYAIMQANNLTSTTIYVGQWLFIPASSYTYPPSTSGTWYQVQYYDTLESIATRFNTSVYAIMQANSLASSTSIYVGQWLFIPAGSYTQPIQPLPGAYPGEAWLGEYFDNMELGGSPQVRQFDPAIDFDWKNASPFPGQIPKDLFSVRWTRNVYFDAGSYYFWAWVDDGVRLYVDDQVVINEWHDADGVKQLGYATLAAGVHRVKVEYYEHGHDAMISVWWEKIY